MNVSDFILNFLEKKKVKHVFTLTGGAISFIIDAFRGKDERALSVFVPVIITSSNLLSVESFFEIDD